MKSVVLILLAMAFGGCVVEGPVQKDPLQEARMAKLLEPSASSEVDSLIKFYALAKAYIRKKESRLYPEGMAKVILRDFGADPEKPSGFKDTEAQDYLAFMKAQVRKWEQGEISWEEVDRSIIARGNEIMRKFRKEANAEALQRAKPGGWVLLRAPNVPGGPLFDPSRPLSEWGISWSSDTVQECERGRTWNLEILMAFFKALPDDHPAKAHARDDMLNAPKSLRCLPTDWVAPLLLR